MSEQPYSQQAETAVLGAILQNPQILEGMELGADDFYAQRNRTIYAAITDMAAMGLPIDVVTVAETLEAKNEIERVGGIPYLVDLRDHCVISNASSYAKIIVDHAKARHIRKIASSMLDVDGSNWQGIMDVAVKSLMETEGVSQSNDATLHVALQEAVATITKAHEADGLVGVDTGLEKLNKLLGGFHDSDLVVIGARPAMGKTSFLLHLAKCANVPAGLISAEQPRDQVAIRLIASDGKIVGNKLRNADLVDGDWARVTGAIGRMRDKQLYINDKSAISITEVMRQARKWKRSHGIKVLYIDYMQRLKPVDKNLPKHEQIGEIAIALKELARELQIPVVALAQVNRAVEQRSDRRPRMGDLKHSGEIEQEADAIIMLYRDEVYNEMTPDSGIAELLIDKNRHGPTGFIKVAWIGEYMSFGDLGHEYGQDKRS